MLDAHNIKTLSASERKWLVRDENKSKNLETKSRPFKTKTWSWN